jgi:NAD-dependent deacetylase
MVKKIVVLSGAGISAESGLATFRDSGGLWEGYDVMEVASIEGWHKNPTKVLDFYNLRRKQASNAQPNAGHLALVALEASYDVTIVTQNVDDLHEKAGSTNVIHLHGQLNQAKSSVDQNLIYDIADKEINIGDKCSKNSQLRPNIVWFGELVPMMDLATTKVKQADAIIVVGTSLQVYPAAGLLDYAKRNALIVLVDPNPPAVSSRKNIKIIAETATKGLIKVKSILENTL